MRSNCLYIFLIAGFILASCNDSEHPADEPVMVTTPDKMNDVVSNNIREVIAFAEKNYGKINDANSLFTLPVVAAFYKSNSYKNVWSDSEIKNPVSDSLRLFIDQARYYGLFPADYHQDELATLAHRLNTDSVAGRNAVLWTQWDLLCTDALFRLLKDLKEGRMVADTLSIVSNKNWADSFFIKKLNEAMASVSLASILNSAEPRIVQYQLIRENLKGFVDSMDTTRYLQVKYPYKDTAKFRENVYARMLQEGIGDAAITNPDSLQLASAIKIYQKKHGLEADGKTGPATIGAMNNNDRVKFLYAAITLDRYKTMDTLPQAYVWVNIPSYRLELWNEDTVVLTSKIIVGKPQTPTPELISRINNLVIYPNWTIPASIIKKDILPELKKDPGYLARKGYNLFTDSGTIVDPYSVKWSNYKTGIPWKVVQGSGDDNALGVFKFNFSNPYSVYLHDTNQRYLFANANRALSHGCVRVQKWQQLADFIAERDSTLQNTGALNYSKDSIRSWVNRQVRKSIMVKNRLPLYIVYMACGVHNNKLEFYNDIYGSIQELADKFFKDK